MVNGVGVDIECVENFRNADSKFLGMVFTDQEIAYCSSKKEPQMSFAGIFCAKEAVIKAHDKKIAIKDIEVRHLDSGKPKIALAGHEDDSIKCSISHSEGFAIAFVVIG